MTDILIELTAVRNCLLLKNEYPAFKAAAKMAREAVGVDMNHNHTWKLLYRTIEESLEEYGYNLDRLRLERGLPYGKRLLAEERKRYCRAFLGCLRATPSPFDELSQIIENH